MSRELEAFEWYLIILQQKEEHMLTLAALRTECYPLSLLDSP